MVVIATTHIYLLDVAGVGVGVSNAVVSMAICDSGTVGWNTMLHRLTEIEIVQFLIFHAFKCNKYVLPITMKQFLLQ